MSGLPVSASGKGAWEVAIQAAKEAGDIIVARFHSQKQVVRKGRGNLVTDVDVLCDEAIVGIIRREYPGHGILTEESEGVTSDSGYLWIIDPLDGTNNYAFGIPFFAVTIALVRGEEILMGLTYDPLRRELFRAEGGGGALLNDSSIAVSRRETVLTSLIGFDMGYDDEGGRQLLDMATALWPRVHSLRVMGSAALGLAYVACGRIDLYCHRWLYPWDIASGILLVREAGGQLTDWGEQPVNFRSTALVAANGALHREFMGLVGEAAGRR